MSDNFSEDTNEMTEFRFWCQRVLPIVYDDNLSPHELLCKVVEYINKLIEGEQQLVTDMAADAKATGDAIADLREDLSGTNTDLLKAFPTDTASGSVASFADGANVPVKSLIVNIDPVQSGSGDPSPDNVRPISGWSEVNVSHSGADMTNPTVISIQLGQTVYGGKLDVTKGELVIDRTMVDLGTLNWDYYQNGLFYTSTLETVAKIRGVCVSDIYVDRFFPLSAPINGYMCMAQNGSRSVFRAVSTAYSDATAFKTAMSGHQLVYELASPLTIQLTPNQINSLYGVNNLWADTGDTEVVYRADTKLFIERLTAPDSADMIADSNIVSGQYFMVGNNLFKATANIANGSDIVVGTNCIRKSLSEALNEINV